MMHSSKFLAVLALGLVGVPPLLLYLVPLSSASANIRDRIGSTMSMFASTGASSTEHSEHEAASMMQMDRLNIQLSKSSGSLSYPGSTSSTTSSTTSTSSAPPGSYSGSSSSPSSSSSSTYRVHMTWGGYPYEISWRLGQLKRGRSDGTSPVPVQLGDGTHSLDMLDSYGDGWNGGSWTLKDACQRIVAGPFTFGNGKQSSKTFTVKSSPCSSVGSGSSSGSTSSTTSSTTSTSSAPPGSYSGSSGSLSSSSGSTSSTTSSTTSTSSAPPGSYWAPRRLAATMTKSDDKKDKQQIAHAPTTFRFLAKAE